MKPLRFLVLLSFGAAAPCFSADPRIVGGIGAERNEFPYQVAITDAMGNQFCGGSLIASNWVLCASHCFAPENMTGPVSSPADVRVQIGFLDLDNDMANGTTIVIAEVADIQNHPGYEVSPITRNDISLLRLSQPVNFGASIQPVALNTEPATPADGAPVTVSGWGTLSSGGPATNHLQEVEVNVVAFNTANTQYGNQLTPSNHLAAAADGKDSCQGDSGGPLVVRSGNSFTQVGVVSFGSGCADPNASGIYERVSTHIPWISTVTGIDFSNGGPGGTSSGGSTAGADTGGGDTAGGDTAGGDTAGGDTAGGDTAGGDTGAGTGGGVTGAGGTGAGGTGGTTGGAGTNQVVALDWTLTLKKPKTDRTVKFKAGAKGLGNIKGFFETDLEKGTEGVTVEVAIRTSAGTNATGAAPALSWVEADVKPANGQGRVKFVAKKFAADADLESGDQFDLVIRATDSTFSESIVSNEFDGLEVK